MCDSRCSSLSQVFQWIQELTSPNTREHALIELSRKREVLPDLAPMLWHSFGTMAALLQEIVMIYPVINPPTLTVCTHYGCVVVVFILVAPHRPSNPTECAMPWLCCSVLLHIQRQELLS